MDGVLRRTPLAVVHQDQFFPSLSLRIAQFIEDIPFSVPEMTSNQKWPFDSYGELLLNFYGGYQTFRPYHPAYKVLQDWDEEALRSRFEGRIVLIGVTATAFVDLHATPFISRCPGVEAHVATALANFHEGNFLRPAPVAVLFLLVLLAAGLGGMLPFRFRTIWSVLALAGLLAAVLAVSLLLFQRFHLWLDFVASSLAALCTYGVSVLSSLRVQEIERIRAQERMAALQQLSDMKSEYVSLVSHELRSPLSSILGFAGTLQRDTQRHFDEKTRQEFYAAIYHESQRLLRLINELLDVARLEAGRDLHLEVQEVNLEEAITQAVATQQFYGQAGHIFHLDLPTELPLVQADPDRLAQILLNLLSNAVKFSPEGGTVTVSACLDSPQVWVCVTDEGIGIPVEQQTQLFQPYQRLEGAQVAKIRGTGLGLYLTKTLVETQEGKIWVESDGEGQGTTFTFTLPIAE